MKNLIILWSAFIILSSCSSSISEKSNSSDSGQETYLELFDGKTLKGWRSFNRDTITGWIVEDGCLCALGEGGDLSGDIITTRQFVSFDLSLEWKMSPEGNSGIMFHVVENGHETTYETGPEYQILDDIGFPVKVEDWQLTGANYAMHSIPSKILKPVGEFNSSRILVDGPHVEHWLNGEKILEYELWDSDWFSRKNSGKWKDYPDYGMAKKGHIALQDHGHKIWFRNIEIKILD